MTNHTTSGRPEDELQWKTALLEAQMEATIDGVLIVNAEMVRVACNQRFLDLWKVPPELAAGVRDEALLMHVAGQIKDRVGFMEKVRHLYAHHDETSRDEIELSDGRYFDRYSAPVFDKRGGYYGRIWTFRDITERKVMEEKLRTMLSFNSQIIADAGVGIVVMDAQCRYLEWNRFMEELLSVPREEVIGKNMLDCFPSLKGLGLEKVMVSALAGETVTSPVIPYPAPRTGKSGWLMSIHTPYRDSNGNVVGILGIIRDVTEAKRNEMELVEAKEYLNAIINTIADPIFVKDRQHKFVLVNNALCKFTGFSREQMLGKDDTDFFPKEQVDIFWGNDEKVFATRAESIQEEAITGAQGVTKNIMTRKTLYSDKNGQDFIVGIIQDVTAFKQAEAELDSARQQLSDIIEFLPDATLVINTEKKVVAWNRAIEEMTGVRKEDIIGKGDGAYAIPFYGEKRPILIDIALDHQQAAMVKYPQLEMKGEVVYGESWTPNLYKGKGAFSWAIASKLYDSKGNLIGAIESIRDITSRKNVEAELKRKMDELERFNKFAVNRELKMVELKKRIGELEAGQENRP